MLLETIDLSSIFNLLEDSPEAVFAMFAPA